MHRFGELIAMLDHTFNTKRKRQLAGGILLSISLLFGGLAFTVISLKTEEIENE